MKICHLMLFAMIFAVPSAFAQMADNMMMEGTNSKGLERACGDKATATQKTLGGAGHCRKMHETMHERMHGEKSAGVMEGIMIEGMGKDNFMMGSRIMGLESGAIGLGSGIGMLPGLIAGVILTIIVGGAFAIFISMRGELIAIRRLLDEQSKDTQSE